MAEDRQIVGTLGILGGGQLGRYLALAAAKLGLQAHVFCPEENAPARQVTALSTVASYNDEDALVRFSKQVDAITLEFENVPVAALDLLATHTLVHPGADVLRISQDRLAEKQFFNSLGIESAPWHPVASPQDLKTARTLKGPAILKTARFGYDGHGQVAVNSANVELEAAWNQLEHRPCVLEQRIDLAAELSVIIAANPSGEKAMLPVAENRHESGILKETRVPARVPDALCEQARETAMAIAASIDLVGLLAVEFFVTGDGRLLANEMAPRPHNSGHWSLDAARPDQFELAVRAAMDLPLPTPIRLCDAVMVNLLGDEISYASALIRQPSTQVHLYGKQGIKPGRKLGHVTYLNREP